MEVKIPEWVYKLDRETRQFKKPKLPTLSDNAIKPFLNPNIKSARVTVYDCPFCKRVFTYPLPFKSHLYSCAENKNVPEYGLLCAKHPECNFMSRKRQDVLAHFNKVHRKPLSRFVVDDSDDEERYSIGDEDDFEDGSIDRLSANKKSRVLFNQYNYVSRDEFKFTCDFLNDMAAKLYRNLFLVDEFYRTTVSLIVYSCLIKIAFKCQF